ncbi:MAG: DUF58 domain-containing protein, partial [Bacteroidota bacterium]
RDFGKVDFLAKQLVEGFITGLHKSPYHGFSVEFAEHRLYNTGESTRHIDWKVFAKTDRLYTKRYEEETNLRCQIVIDNSSSMRYPVKTKGKLLFSTLAAGALSHLLQRQRDAVGLSIFSDNIELSTDIKSTPSHTNKIMIHLQNLLKEEDESAKTGNVGKVLHEIAEKNRKRSLIILFSDMFEDENHLEEVFSGLKHLKHNKHEVLLFHVTDQNTELSFNFTDRPHEFIDLESGEKIKLQPSQIKADFQQSAEVYYQKLKLKCAQFKIDFIEADIHRGYDAILTAYLIKRAKMK